jgi:tRNA dimethylallyltransferase
MPGYNQVQSSSEALVSMLPPPFNNALVLTGPTGSGKTMLGIALAQQLDAEIVSMDSMALYRGMDIGTAKPTLVERALVRHHLIDVLEPWESSSVAWWLERAAECSREIDTRGKRVLFVGGTPLYLKALLCGLFDGPPADDALRRQLQEEAERGGSVALHARLVAIDPTSGERIHPNDVRRTIRALEVYTLTGQPLSAWQTQWNRSEQPDVKAAGARALSVNGDAVLWLDLPRAELYERIDRRVEAMFAAGFVEEVCRLRTLPRPCSREAHQALGYREVCEHLDGRLDRATTITLVQTRSRQFAKRQLTWFRHLPQCRPATKELTAALWCRTMNG